MVESPRTAKGNTNAQTTNRASGWSAYHTILIIGIAISAVTMLGQSIRELLPVSAALTPVVALAAVVTAVLGTIQTGVRKEERMSIVWLCFTLTVVVWFLSSVLFLAYSLFGMPIPIISWADVFELAGYLPLMIGLVIQVWPFREAFEGRTLRLVLALVVVVSAVVLYILLLASFHEGITPLALAANVPYPILNVVSVAVAIPTLVVFMRGTFWKPFLFVVIGLVIALVADIIATWAILVGTYYAGHPSDLLYSLGFLSALLGFHLRRKQFVQASI